MNEVNKNTEALKKNFLELTELKHILSKTQIFFDEVHIPQTINVNSYSLMRFLCDGICSRTADILWFSCQFGQDFRVPGLGFVSQSKWPLLPRITLIYILCPYSHTDSNGSMVSVADFVRKIGYS
jgi:hypothetical protein